MRESQTEHMFSCEVWFCISSGFQLDCSERLDEDLHSCFTKRSGDPTKSFKPSSVQVLADILLSLLFHLKDNR